VTGRRVIRLVNLHTEPFFWSDAWLLLSILLVSADGPADRDRITHAGDYINRAIFTDAEWSGGIERLRARGYVIEEGGLYRAGPSVVEWYAQACPGRLSLWKVLERLEGFLGIGRGS